MKENKEQLRKCEKVEVLPAIFPKVSPYKFLSCSPTHAHINFEPRVPRTLVRPWPTNNLRACPHANSTGAWTRVVQNICYWVHSVFCLRLINLQDSSFHGWAHILSATKATHTWPLHSPATRTHFSFPWIPFHFISRIISYTVLEKCNYL